MKTNLNFENKSTKELLSKLDFEYFLKQNIEVENYSSENTKLIYENYDVFKKKVKGKSKENRKQFFFYCESNVRKMFTGGMLPASFGLDESRRYQIIDFPATGKNWAYFEYWQKTYKLKLTKEKVWSFVVKTGSVLAFILSILKLYEIILKK
ncbi:hypothetical protein [Lutibacter sp.]|uniref:hypothetical protein n=1 Tax=Lutibacter sp. TaxID=1925666 RepID=UPI0025C31C13|nr:hypothetical protein [Lutibacter sp.]MCF6182652.1 hypothetical protein [Lutibacter sp.]